MTKRIKQIEKNCESYFIVFASILKEDPSMLGSKVESFVVDGALTYYEKLEEYKICTAILNFKKSYPERIVNVSKEDFFKDFI